LQVFSLRSMVSGAAFHRAYQRATQQAFLEAHEQAFHYFGGVFRLLRYDYVARHIIVVGLNRYAVAIRTTFSSYVGIYLGLTLRLFPK
jgi:transposase